MGSLKVQLATFCVCMLRMLYIYIHPHISCNRWLQISISQYRTQSYCHTVDRQNVAPIGKRPEHDTQWDLYKEFVFKILTLPIYPVWLGRHTRSTDVYWAQLVEKYFEWKKSGTNIYIYKGMYIYIYISICIFMPILRINWYNIWMSESSYRQCRSKRVNSDMNTEIHKWLYCQHGDMLICLEVKKLVDRGCK